ncbi:MAG: RNA-binding domain protein [Solirubrobacterales bacterium]|jgi:ribosome-associated heat shock protein Hsp15|nr:RNA-binding domain protein [Solirubrobacterales bacterium]
MDGVRLDKWLWAARFYKTRGVAAESVKGGFVRYGSEEQRTKPAREIVVGDVLRIQTEHGRFVVEVVGLSEHRRPSVEAVQLYVETEESKRKREEFAALAKATGVPIGQPGPRPTKRDRRRFEATPGTRRNRE